MTTATVEHLHLPASVDRAQLLAPWAQVLQVSGYPLAIEASTDYRREVTRRSPVRFALTYLGHHLRSPETRGVCSLAEHHIALSRTAASWRTPGRHRDIWVAPRFGAKSTWMVILTLWALAHGHRRFAVWFSDSASQVRMHLATLRRELEYNQLLRSDFPELLPPPRGRAGNRDAQDTYTARGGAVVAARGVDTRSLGMKLGTSRPDLICLDDVEPDASNYSMPARGKRLDTILNALLPMNEQAAVLWTGTVTMHGSILHAAVQSAVGEGTPQPWIVDEGFRVHYTPAVQEDPTSGEERSFWPERYGLDYLNSIRHTINYALNFACRPPLPGGHQWTASTFRHAELPVGRLVMQIDPAPTATPKSDFSAIVVGGRVQLERAAEAGLVVPPGSVSIERAWQVRLTPARLADRVRTILRQNPRIRLVRIAATGGSETWRVVFADLPGGVELQLHGDGRTTSDRRPEAKTPSKDLLFAGLLERYERGTVWHAERLHDLELQLQSWPEVEHDDLGDATAHLVRYLQEAG